MAYGYHKPSNTQSIPSSMPLKEGLKPRMEGAGHETPLKEGLKPRMEGAGHETLTESLTEARPSEACRLQEAFGFVESYKKQALTHNLLALALSYVDASGMNCMCCLSIEIT